ncbi:hypothetical protein [Streptomyces pseudogriseolus]|uniref:hypothetical protein n=1 Tax=Streptomyces pseudogriseolus TaxID=36817 RepID=UPI00190F13AE|nr:hypothetical protein [Streptomyces gancidicus]
MKLLKTPTAQLAVNGGSQHPDKRKQGNHGPTLADEVEHLLPDGAGARRLLPTPRASRGASSTEIMYGLGAGRTDESRPQGEALLPTPTATPYGSNQSASPGATPRPSLDSLAPKLLPTPIAGDANGGRNATAGRSPGSKHSVGWTLSDVVYAGKLPNPSAPPADAPSTSTTQAASAPDASTAQTPSSAAPTSKPRLLPTPRGTDGRKGSPNQHGSRGDLTLASAAARLLPTPRASDTGTPGRRASEGFRPPLSQVVLPLIPTPTAADSDRTSPTYSRGNPTLTGAITDPPSDGGKPSSDDVPPGQLMIEVD